MSDAMMAIGTLMPQFNPLRGVDGKSYAWDNFKSTKLLVIVFSCNHCPYVQAYEERMIAFQRDYAAKGVQLVAINSNETSHYPTDTYEEMVKRAMERGFNFPYLRDEDQTVAEAFGATHTPEFFVFAAEEEEAQQRLRYHGKMDDNYQNPSAVTRKYVEEAVNAILAGKPVAEPETHSIGCTIKWK